MQPLTDVVGMWLHGTPYARHLCCRAHLSVRDKMGSGLFRDHINSRPADLVPSWDT